jgi:predicted lipid-binding transport protein (Tim44 family)
MSGANSENRKPSPGPRAILAGLIAGIVAGSISYVFLDIVGLVIAFIIGAIVGSRTVLLMAKLKEKAQ